MSPQAGLPDGLDLIREEFESPALMRLIERTARWVSPETFRLLPVWYPEYGRGSLFYKAGWTEPQLNTTRAASTSVHKAEGNRYANIALTKALGLRSGQRTNWSCCHIWGVDDPTFASTNTIVRDPRYYSCVGNMLLLPTPLKAFTDAMPEVKAMLRTCAHFLYGWRCEHAEAGELDPERVAASAAYPGSWPRNIDGEPPTGTIALTERIREAVLRRRAAIARDLEIAGERYPKSSVLEVLQFWNVDLIDNQDKPVSVLHQTVGYGEKSISGNTR